MRRRTPPKTMSKRAHARLVEQVDADLLEHPGADAREHVVAAALLEDDVVDARLVQQGAQDEARGAGADDCNLGPHDSSPLDSVVRGIMQRTCGCAPSPAPHARADGRASRAGPAPPVRAAARATMIGRLSGLLAGKNPPQVLVDAGGVGYELDVPMSTFFNLPELGQPVVLLTHFVVREDAQLLYGFLSAAERDAFRLLVKISGVGPRTALALLSGLSVAELAHAVSVQEAGRLVKVPGIGKKTAERLLLELKGKLGPELALPSAGSAGSEAGSDIVQALLALGYNDKEAASAMKALPADVGVAEGIRLALKALTR